MELILCQNSTIVIQLLQHSFQPLQFNFCIDLCIRQCIGRLQFDCCNLTIAIQPLQFDPCNLTVAIWPLQFNPCNSTLAIWRPLPHHTDITVLYTVQCGVVRIVKLQGSNCKGWIATVKLQGSNCKCRIAVKLQRSNCNSQIANVECMHCLMQRSMQKLNCKGWKLCCKSWITMVEFWHKISSIVVTMHFKSGTIEVIVIRLTLIIIVYTLCEHLDPGGKSMATWDFRPCPNC